MTNPRWQGDKSQFAWEQEALDHIRSFFPDRAPYVARQCFTFTGTSGHARECDLLIGTPAGLTLVEIKSHSGTATNQGAMWSFSGYGRSFVNPYHLTDQKAKELKSRLHWAAQRIGIPVGEVPFVNAVTFLSAADLVCNFDQIQREHLYGREGKTAQTKLGGIWTALNGQPGYTHNRLTPGFARNFHRLLETMGVMPINTEQKVNSYRLGELLDDGPTWSDYLGENTALAGDAPRRIRIYVTGLTADGSVTDADRQSAERAANREYRSLLGIQHDGIVQAEAISNTSDLGTAVIFRHGKDWQRLDQYMAQQGADLDMYTRVAMLRQLTDALGHAHRQHLFHRALAARSVWVDASKPGEVPTLRIADWQTAAQAEATFSTLSGAGPLPSLARHIELTAGPYLAPDLRHLSGDPTPLDVFGLGAIGFLLLTGRPPALNGRDLGEVLSRDEALVPSAVSDDISFDLDDLIRGATRSAPSERYESVKDFSDILAIIEDDLRAPTVDELDALDARGKDRLGEYEIVQVLGTGATARALLAKDSEGKEVVLKVALATGASERLELEAVQLRDLHSGYIVRYLAGPLPLGKRKVLVLDRAGKQTLADYLRKEGRLTIEELQDWSHDLFEALRYLEQEEVYHRDIKPDNLGIHEFPRKGKKGRQLVLFDFSLAGVSDNELLAGTQGYLDPFLGSHNRLRYDGAAERYAVAVTLYEMATRELPSWGDGSIDPKLLRADVVIPVISKSSFDPALAAGLEKFFRKALHREASERYLSHDEMRTAFAKVFESLDEPVPSEHPTTNSEGGPLPDGITANTSIYDVGLSARAVSLAVERLNVSTAGELIEIPANKIAQLRGTGLPVRNALNQRAREIRDRLKASEPAPTPVADLEGAAPSIDEMVRRIVPGGHNLDHTRRVRLLLGLPDGDRTATEPGWATVSAITQATGIDEEALIDSLQKARLYWDKSVKGMSALRDTIATILTAHGRVMELGGLSVALLQERGSDLDDAVARRVSAMACVRAALEWDSTLAKQHLAFRRLPDGAVLVATISEDPAQPSDTELLDHAVALGARASELVKLTEAELLPSPSRVLAALLDVPRPENMPALPDTDLVRLAAGASPHAAATQRLELYPVDLEPERAIRVAQLGVYLTERATAVPKLVERVYSRLPELRGFPADGTTLAGLLEADGYDTEIGRRDGVEYLSLKAAPLTRSLSARHSRTADAQTPQQEARALLAVKTRDGGLLAIKVPVKQAQVIAAELAGLPQVRAVDVSERFLATLKQIVDERGGKPSWEAVLKADSPDASPRAQSGFMSLLEQVWPRLEAEFTEIPGVVLLHNATPLGRYPGGQRLLGRLIAAAREAEANPHALWVLCPMESLGLPAQIDGNMIGAISAQAEQLALTGALVTWTGDK
ncbi:protein kinase [Actinorhabdospora filicis]|uniref:non-specific serine/threonine protein kinase n=1 Tax=Actinorhabdospora filicis TaxID=1785913 RepID=A0A9W6SP58_9ACTN|nr:BREX system serine/threonine kinase PglW [Actinorhabdospora filicis]GLZ79455.1 protein kinase [Actinorhabdospora filicis]